MRRKWSVLWSIPVVVGLLGWANVALAQEKKEEPKKVEPAAQEPKKEEAKNLVATLKAAPDAKTFCKLLESADLVKELEGVGPFTVFVPTDAAFDKLGKAELDELQKPEKKAELQKILKNHIVKGKHMAAMVKTMKEVKTETGPVAIKVEGEKVHFGAADIVKTDVSASNGVIHMIDAVVMPAEEKPKEPAAKP